MVAKHQKYSPEFREEAAKMVVEDLGLLHTWPANWG
jgi:hypothetical protein